MNSPEIAAARIQAELARERLRKNVADLQDRLRPAHLAEQAVDGIRRRGEEMADGAVAMASRRPAVAASAAAGITALIGASFLWRRSSDKTGDRS